MGGVDLHTFAIMRQSSAETGTHFPVVRLAAHRDGDLTTPYARLQNLARARVVVS